jgi:hypothetical protein
MTTTTKQQFTNKREFASFVIESCGGRAWLMGMNKLNKGYGCHSSEHLIRIGNHVTALVRRGELSFDYYAVADGLSWGVKTGRIDPVIVSDLATMTVRQSLELIWQMSQEVKTMGDVPRYLIHRYAVAHGLV